MTPMSAPTPIEILLVEDNEPDVILTQEAFQDARIANHLHVTRDGVEAMAFLRREPPFQDAPTPDVVLLDINMPRKSGLEVLEEVKHDPLLRHIPVVILTTSQADEDILRSYQNHASSYIVKPVGFENFYQAIRAFETYWLSFVRLPPR
ncbi:response regulator [Deinococcus aquiradiocola]|uniref:Response regulator n=1 Tax=Deinococcus aquiradiocola TaxID=393059 RepID=A0A917PQY9_9DEIO|nr:response regulator [Deinococcus aquiradiocola]GGJ88656.1 response regulator [Deinococcus aquiradiocola]